jgi:hypothetical protein
LYPDGRLNSGGIMKTVSVQLPESVIRHTDGSEEGLSRESQFLLALKLFELGRLTTGEAASMCGMNAVDFLLFAEKAVKPGATVAAVGTLTAANLMVVTPPSTVTGNAVS